VVTARLWNPLALASALKTTVGILVAWAIVLWYQWPDPFLAPIAVLFLQTPYLGSSLFKGLMRVFGTLAGALLVLGLLALLAQERWPLITAVSLVLACSVYMIRHSRYGYAWFMVAITTSIIAVDAWGQPLLAFDLAVFRTSEAIAGILVVLTINGIFWPRTGGRVYSGVYRETLAALAEHLRTTARILSGETESAFPALPETLVGAAPRLRQILSAAMLDSANFKRLHSTYEAQIQGLNAALGTLAGFTENLRLAAQSERAFLTAPQRLLLGSALAELGQAAQRLSVSANGAGTTAIGPEPGFSDRLRDQLRAEASDDQSGAESAVLQALYGQLLALERHIEQQQRTAAAIAAGRALPSEQPPPPPRLPLAERIADALPNALIMVLAFWLLMLLWIWFQWPPVGLFGVLMAVVVIGIDTLQNAPASAPGRRVALGAAIGVLVAAPFYFVLMPRLDGYWELATALFPLFFAIAYFFHALPPPQNMVFTGIAVTCIVMLQLEPHQSYGAASYLASAASQLTGYGAGLLMLGMARARSPQEHLRRALRALLETMRDAQAELADPSAENFANRLAAHEERIRTRLQVFAQVLPQVCSTRSTSNSRSRVEALGTATERLVLRFRALHHERARWSGPVRQSLYSTSVGRMLGPAIEQTLARLTQALDAFTPVATTQALDEARSAVRTELSRLEAHRRSLDDDERVLYTLTIAGHYVAVAQALREVAAALSKIDWAAWRMARF
jgi:uncharacterized membrane protein YccC